MPQWWLTKCLLLLLAISCIALLLAFKTAGIVLVGIICIAVFIMYQSRPDRQETETIKYSIRLSAQDISAVLDDFDTFANGTDADSLADRTLNRPALADKDCSEPRIEKFHFLYASNLRFLHRLDARLAADLSVSQAESMLETTDQRAMELQESWISARKAAFQLGPGYRGETGRRSA